MQDVIEKNVGCPYCGELITMLVETLLPEQSYVEDCQVCCRPIVLAVSVDEGGDVAVTARTENE